MSKFNPSVMIERPKTELDTMFDRHIRSRCVVALQSPSAVRWISEALLRRVFAYARLRLGSLEVGNVIETYHARTTADLRSLARTPK